MMLKWALIVALAYGGLVGCVFIAQESLVYFPNMGRQITVTPAAHGLAYEDVAIRTEDGETLHAWWLPAPQATGAVVLFHGNAGNISHRIDYARMFHRLGYGTLLVDYRGYGKSTGTPSEQGTYRDALASWRWLTDTRGMRGQDIVVFGESLGGAVACWLAARHAPRALVLASTFTSVPDLGSEIYPFLPVRLISRFQYNNLECVPKVDAPVLVIHSPGDDIVPFAHGRRVYEAAREPRQFLEIRGSHNDGFVFMRPEWVEALGGFLERARGRAGGAGLRRRAPRPRGGRSGVPFREGHEAPGYPVAALRHTSGL